ncbi:MAG: glycosyltransferase [Bacteroidales bacterium]|nr:glycosyltransferase [Bacteroidales bacterium]
MKKLCMLAISINEEKHIEFWINNHKDFVDNIMLVDTGSTDKTVEIAIENKIKVLNFKWEHDFSKAKNFALRMCDNEYKPDWILFLSPDYWITHEDMKKIREAIEVDGFDAYKTILMYHPNGWFNFENITIYGQKETNTGQIVLFKNDPSIFYSGRVHETVDSSLVISNKKIGYLDITRHHDDSNIDVEAREIYYNALRANSTLHELDIMRDNLYKRR